MGIYSSKNLEVSRVRSQGSVAKSDPLDAVGKIDMKDLIPGEVRKENLRKVAEIIGQPEVAAKKKKAAQYGSGAMNLFRKIAKKKGVTVNEMVTGMKDGQ